MGLRFAPTETAFLFRCHSLLPAQPGRRKVHVGEWQDGRVEISCDGVPLPYTTVDKEPRVTARDVERLAVPKENFSSGKGSGRERPSKVVRPECITLARARPRLGSARPLTWRAPGDNGRKKLATSRPCGSVR
jgi:hypothetical protein